MPKGKAKKPSTSSSPPVASSSDSSTSGKLLVVMVALLVAVVAVLLHQQQPVASSTPGLDPRVSCGNKHRWKAVSSPSSLRVTDGGAPAVWGPWRPGVYFGMKTKSKPYFLSTGILWSDGQSLNKRKYRHSVHTDEIEHFEWLRNDGKTFGIEQLKDRQARLVFNASFIVDSGDQSEQSMWHQHYALRRPLKGTSSNDVSSISFIHYFGMDCDESNEAPLCFTPNTDISNLKVHVEDSGKDAVAAYIIVSGFSSLSGWFSLTYSVSHIENTDQNKAPIAISFFGPGGNSSSSNRLSSTINRIMNSNERRKVASSLFDENGNFDNVVETDAVGIFVQVLSKAPFDIRLDYTSNANWTDRDEVLKHNDLSGSSGVNEKFLTKMKLKCEEFDDRFDNSFQLDRNEVFSSKHLETAKRGLSSLLGGLGYFHGSPEIGHSLDFELSETKDSSEAAKGDAIRNQLALFSGTPSRSSFPRGFLWDEGFHQMLMSNWDPHLSMEVIRSWMGCMMRLEEESGGGHCQGGWIPREMILGEEALSVVPSEFVTQRVDVANPPTLIIVVEKLLDRIRSGVATEEELACGEETSASKGYCEAHSSHNNEDLKADVSVFMKDIYFSLHDWVQWLIHSQGGSEEAPEDSFRWRGRREDPNRLAPNTLASGLDDYPRSQFPSPHECHVDLLSWVAMSCRAMSKISAHLLERNARNDALLSPDFVQQVERISDHFYSPSNVSRYTDRLLSLHWSEQRRNFFDIGLVGSEEGIEEGVVVRCTESPGGGTFKDVVVPVEKLQRSRGRESSVCPPDHPVYMYPLGDGRGGLQRGSKYVSNAPAVGFIPREGYVNIFPLLLRLLPPSSEQLEHQLDFLSAPTGLWSDHGLRSLSKKDLFYQQENAPGDAPYWRGPIWMPVNYLALGALRHYSELEDCPSRKKAGKIYKKLRSNLLRTVMKEYDRSGYFWEIYDDSTGQGMRGHPFAGWTTLFVNIMAEKY